MSDIYRFSLEAGAVSAVYEFDDGRWQRDMIEADETWSLTSDGVLKAEWEGWGTEYSLYADSDGDGIYVKAAEWYDTAGGDTRRDDGYDDDQYDDDQSDDDQYDDDQSDDHGSIAGDSARAFEEQAYRLYRTAFDRAPEQEGLDHWKTTLGSGTTMDAVARQFMSSPEFEDRYGQDIDDGAFVVLLYRNVLDREPDTGGFGHWTEVMAAGMERAEVLCHFSESTENKQAVSSLLTDGLWMA